MPEPAPERTPPDDTEVIHMTAAEWNTALRNSLDTLGLTWEQLAEQARAADFSSLKARQLWLMAGPEGFRTPPDDTTEVPCPRWSIEEPHPAHDWDAPVDGRSKCPGWAAAPVTAEDDTTPPATAEGSTEWWRTEVAARDAEVERLRAERDEWKLAAATEADLADQFKRELDMYKAAAKSVTVVVQS